MLKSFGRTLLTGLFTMLPVVLTLYLLYWLAVSAETVLGNMIRLVLPDGMYRPGMGVAAGVLVTFMVGLLMSAYLVQRLFDQAEQLLYRVPLIKSIYRAIRDLMDYLSPARKKDFGQVVAVTLENGMQLIGFITRSERADMPRDFGEEDSVLVYIPMSYMIGGFAVLTPRSAVRPLDMSMEEAMRFVLTAGLTGSGASSSGH
jgi:uncharacterized membrane protein